MIKRIIVLLVLLSILFLGFKYINPEGADRLVSKVKSWIPEKVKNIFSKDGSGDNSNNDGLIEVTGYNTTIKSDYPISTGTITNTESSTVDTNTGSSTPDSNIVISTIPENTGKETNTTNNESTIVSSIENELEATDINILNPDKITGSIATGNIITGTIVVNTIESTKITGSLITGSNTKVGSTTTKTTTTKVYTKKCEPNTIISDGNCNETIVNGSTNTANDPENLFETILK